MFMNTTFHQKRQNRMFTVALPLLVIADLCGSPSAQAATGPCDILGLAGTGCVAAYSTTRALYDSYTGPLYQVTKSGGDAIDINTVNGVADAGAQDNFCVPGNCTITIIYDQSGNGNHLTPALGGTANLNADIPASADALPVTIGNQRVYGISITPGIGYRNNSTTNIPLLFAPEGVYMVTSTHAASPTGSITDGCCFDFGNAETNNDDNGAGHLDALNLIADDATGNTSINLDLENGIYPSDFNPFDIGPTTFLTAAGWNNGEDTYSVYAGDAQSGDPLATPGPLPLPDGYGRMKKEGGIVLGIGGDNSNRAYGYFFEGAMTQGTPTTDTLNAVQQNIAMAGYSN